MIDSIKGTLGAVQSPLTAKTGAAPGAEQVKDSFGSVLKESIEKVNSLQTEADASIQGLATGKVSNIHETMIAIEKANISFNLMLQVRNKLIQAYEEVMRMQV